MSGQTISVWMMDSVYLPLLYYILLLIRTFGWMEYLNCYRRWMDFFCCFNMLYSLSVFLDGCHIRTTIDDGWRISSFVLYMNNHKETKKYPDTVGSRGQFNQTHFLRKTAQTLNRVSRSPMASNKAFNYLLLMKWTTRCPNPNWARNVRETTFIVPS